MSYIIGRPRGGVKPGSALVEAILEGVEKTQLAANLCCHCCRLMQGRTDEIVVAEVLEIAILPAVHARIVRLENVFFEVDIVRVEPQLVPRTVLRSLSIGV